LMRPLKQAGFGDWIPDSRFASLLIPALALSLLLGWLSYRLVEEEGAAGIIIDVREKPWGPNYLQGGLRFQGDWNSGSGFNIGVSYTRTAVNPLGGEFRSIIEVGETQRLFGEFYQPLSVHNPYFINPQLEYRRIPIGFFTEGQEIARYHLTQIRFSLEAGKELGDWGELRFGYQYGWDDVELEIGSPSLEEGSFQEGSLFLQLGVDTLDNLYFPTAGQRAEIRYRGYREVLGGDHDFDQISAFWTGAYSYGKNTLLLHGRLGYMLDDDAPVYGRFLLGGFLNLSGFDRFELSGQHLAHGYVGFMRRLDEDSIVPVYLGGTVEMGNTWERAGDFGDGWFVGGSLYLGLDTYIGPLYIGVAAAEADHQTLFMFLGAPF
ncbi:MAG TPA: hypothetical protein EYP90_11260, partial [Chromatiaceae bacterium]|nr:hypothetical protein [Chromatiaceae bacterium]